MNARWFVAWAVLTVSLLAACSSSSKKVVPPPSDAGAAGEAREESAGTGGGGAPSDNAGAAGVSGAAGAVEAGAGGEPGLPPVTLEALAGDWSGTITPTYFCESSPAPIEISIEGATLTTTDWPGQAVHSATIQQQVGQAFTVALDIAATPYMPAGTAYAQLYVDPSAQYALLVAQELDTNGNSNSNGYIALLERGARSDPGLLEQDIVGDWTGASVRLNADFAVTETFASSGSFDSIREGGQVIGYALTGEDQEGELGSGEVTSSNDLWTARSLGQAELDYSGSFLMSSDKQVLLGAFLQDTDEDGNGALCDQDIFFDMTDHKFALWKRVQR